MARIVDRETELRELVVECLPASGYVIFAGIFDARSGRIRWNYIKRDFYNTDVLTAIGKFKAMAVDDMEGRIREGGDSDGEGEKA